ncbi:MAG: Panacea domain-containing protein [Acetobacteraceae bacterium]
MSVIRFTFNAPKTLEAVLFLVGRRQGGMDRHSILKLLFFADVDHLNRYGRPITGDQYRALTYGPVGQGAYDLLKLDPLALEAFDEEPFPLEAVGRFHIRPGRAFNAALLSRSDVAALSRAFETYGALDFDGRTDASHRHVAYQRARDAGALLIRYEDFLEPGEDSAERAAELAEAGPLMRL